MRRLRIALLSSLLVLTLATIAPSAQAAAGRTAYSPAPAAKPSIRLLNGSRPAPVRGSYHMTEVGRTLLSRGYLVADPSAYQRDKARAAGIDVRDTPAPGPLAPTTFRSWQGVNDLNVTPPDTTGAIGNTRYIELVNDKFGIYNRTSNTALSTGTLSALTDDTGIFSFLTDPQILWDQQTKRFYYVVLNASVALGIADGIDYDFGFSTTASPSTGSDTDWCKYSINYLYEAAARLPDYEKMGDTKNFIVFGANVFNVSPQSFVGADAQWVTKPPAGTACPDPTTFLAGVKANLKNADTTKSGTLEPANQSDASSTGWIVSAPKPGGGTKNFVTVFKVTRNADGTAKIQGTGASVTVPSYAFPPLVPQSGTTKTLDSLDGRLTQAQSAIDPSHGTATAIWTQHTVANSTRTKVDWYEIDPVNHVTFQTGSVSSASLFVFNGAVSSDRLVNGTTKAFGNSMVLDFNTSSSSTFVAIQMVSKIGAGAQSGFVLIKQSPGKNQDFSCDDLDENGQPTSEPTCRWGDYAGATPDPGANPAGAHGQVWGTNEWNVASTTKSNVDWRTQNFAASP